MKIVGGWGGCNNTPCPEREGLTAKINKFLQFSFSYFSFCHNNDYVPEILETLGRFGQVLYF